MFRMLYITSPWLISLFSRWEFVPLHLILLLPHPHPLWQPLVCSLYLSLFLLCYVCSFDFLNSTYKWNHTVFIFLCSVTFICLKCGFTADVSSQHFTLASSNFFFQSLNNHHVEVTLKTVQKASFGDNMFMGKKISLSPFSPPICASA